MRRNLGVPLLVATSYDLETGNWLRLFMGRELEEVAVKHCIFFLELLERGEGTDHTYLSTHPSKSCGGIGTGSAPHASTRVNPSTSQHMSSCGGI